MYFPKSQIKTNLYANTGEYIIKTTGEDYVGYYWKISTGKIFTGKTPQDAPNLELIPNPITTSETSINPNILKIVNTAGDPDPLIDELFYDGRIINNYIFLKSINENFSQIMPTYSPNIPTEKDATLGEFRRYFCKKINEIQYIEVDKNIYDKFIKKEPNTAYQLFTFFNIPWKINNESEEVIYKTNKNIVKLIMKQLKLPKFDKYLKEDYIKYIYIYN